MSDREKQFWDLAEEFIAIANQKVDDKDLTLVGDALLYAAARFNAYGAAAATEERREFKEDLEEIRTMLLEQYEAMLNASLDDYLENYKVLLER